MYVLESLADAKGNVASVCSGGDCTFNVETMRVLGPNGIEGNVFNEFGEGLYQANFTGAELNQIEATGLTNAQRSRALVEAARNNVKVDLSKVPGVTARNLEIQKQAIAYAKANNVFMTEAQKTLGTYVATGAKNFKLMEGVKMPTTTNVTSTIAQSASSAASSIATTQQSTTSSAISSAVSAASSATSTATEVAQAASEAAQAVGSVSQEVAEAAQEAAAEASAVASSVITSNDVEAISQLAGDALGSWVLVDAATGKQMADPGRGTSGVSNATWSHIQTQTDRVAAFGGIYVLESLASESGNVTTACSGGDCEFDLGNKK